MVQVIHPELDSVPYNLVFMWFAWYPVRTVMGRLVWLCWVTVRSHGQILPNGDLTEWYEYRTYRLRKNDKGI